MLTRRMIGIDPFGAIRNNVDRVIDGFIDGGSQGLQRLTHGARGFGALDAWEDGDKLHVEVDVPGLALDQIEVTVEDDTLTISGKREPRSFDGENLIRYANERVGTEFRRVIELPGDTDTENIEASLKNGVLFITLGKVEAVKPKRIEVKGGE